MKRFEAISGANSKIDGQKRNVFSQLEKAGSDPVAAALGLRSHTQAVRPKMLKRLEWPID